MAMGFAILKLLTLGQFTPFAEMRLWRYRICNAFFGTAQARFTGSGREVYKPFLISFLAFIAALAVAFGGAWLIEGAALERAIEFLSIDFGEAQNKIGRAHV